MREWYQRSGANTAECVLSLLLFTNLYFLYWHFLLCSIFPVRLHLSWCHSQKIIKSNPTMCDAKIKMAQQGPWYSLWVSEEIRWQGPEVPFSQGKGYVQAQLPVTSSPQEKGWQFLKGHKIPMSWASSIPEKFYMQVQCQSRVLALSSWSFHW